MKKSLFWDSNRGYRFIIICIYLLTLLFSSHLFILRAAQVAVAVIDAETSQVTPSMVSIVSLADGKVRLPPDGSNYNFPGIEAYMNIFYDGVSFDTDPNWIGPVRINSGNLPYWSEDNIYLTSGDFTIQLEAGDYRIAVERGNEYIPVTQNFSVSGSDINVDIIMQRWINMPERGWYSGDLHIHHPTLIQAHKDFLINYAIAEDIHVANILEMGDINGTVFLQGGYGPSARYQQGDFCLVPGMEDPRSTFGHINGNNVTSSYYDNSHYNLYDLAFDRILDRGGLVGVCHLPYNPVAAELGMPWYAITKKIDYVEMLQFGDINTSDYYDYLNLGFKLTAASGSDIPWGFSLGECRTYIYTGPVFDVDLWFENLRIGKSFVSNGPILELKVDGQLPGSEIIKVAGSTVTVSIEFFSIAAIGLPVDLLVVGSDGIVKILDHSGAATFSDEFSIIVDHNQWITASAVCDNGAYAHTSPVYIVVNDKECYNPRIGQTIIDKRLANVDNVRTDVEGWIGDPDRDALLERMDNADTYYGNLRAAMIADSPYKIISSAGPLAINNDGISYSTITARICDMYDNNILSDNWIDFSLSSDVYATLASSLQTLVIENIWTQRFTTYIYITANLDINDEYYIDRDYTITSMPAGYEGLTWIKTANDDKKSIGDQFLQFNVNTDVTVYVGIDTRIAVPGWMGSWTNTGDSIAAGGMTFNLYSKNFSVGTIKLGGNENISGSASMYTVLVRQTGSGESVVRVMDGITTIGLRSTTSEGTTTVYATSCGLIRGEVDVVTSGDTRIPEKIIVTASETEIVADGTATSLLTALIVDQFSDPVTTSTEMITFALTGEGNLVGTTMKPAAGGEATVHLESSVTGMATVTATTDGLIEGSVDVTFIAGYPAKVIASANPTNIINDGVSVSTITAQICDTDDNLITSATNMVTFNLNGITYATILGAGVPPPLSITNIWVQSGSAYVIAKVNEGEQYYIDRTYTIETIPEAYEGLDWIKTANNDKTNSTNPFLTFDINTDATVWIGMDSRISVPGWVGSWTNTGDSITNVPSIESMTYNLYSRAYPAGSVSLGGNEETQPDNSMYIVLVKPETGQLPDQVEVQASGGETKLCLQSTTSEGVTTVSATVNGLTRGTVEVVTSVTGPSPVKVLLNANPTSIVADGSTTSVITAGICDSGNQTITTATDNITFTVSGNGTLVGGTVKGSISGEATIQLQSTTTPGGATVTATAAGLTQDTVLVTTTQDPAQPVKVLVNVNPTFIFADGSTTSLITASIANSSDQTITTSTENITFSVSGNGTLVGGTVKGSISGEATIQLQSTTTPGGATVTATAAGLTEGTVNVLTTDIPNTAPQVTGITAVQTAVTGNVLIGYDLSDSEQNAIDIEVRYYNGTIVQACSTLIGDRGAGVATGTGKSVTWNAKADFDGESRSDVYVQIHADDLAGETADENSVMLTLDTKAPVISTNVELQSLPISGDGSFTLHAVWNEDNPGTPQFYYNLNGTGYTGQIPGTAGNDSTRTCSVSLDGDDSITAIKCSYTDGYGNSAEDEAASEVYVKPLTPEVPTVENVTETSLTVAINANTGENGSVWYVIKATSIAGGEQYVQSNGILGGSPEWRTAAAWGSPVTAQGLVTGNTYYISVAAGNTNDDNPTVGENSASGYGNSALGTPEVPLVYPPTSLIVESYGRHEISLSWQGGAGNDRYVIARSTDSINFEEIVHWDDGLKAEVYTDTGLKVGTQYWYRVYGCDEYTNRSSFIGLSRVTVYEVIVNLDTGAQVEKEHVKIAVFPGTFTEDSYIHIRTYFNSEEIDDVNENVNLKNLVGSITEVNAFSTTGNKLGVSSFEKGVIIKIYYKGLVISELLEESLKIYVLDEDNKQWNRVGGTVNTADEYVSATVNHFSVYCLMGESSEETLQVRDIANYPNPFSEGTVFTFYLTRSARVKLNVYTISGRLGKSFDEVELDAGYNEIPEGDTWDGEDDSAKELASGVYFYKVTATREGEDPVSETGKLVIIK